MISIPVFNVCYPVIKQGGLLIIMKILTGIVCLVFGWVALAGAENITFETNSQSEDGKPLRLTAELQKPDGDGPFPAVVFLHGCAGTGPRYNEWAKHLLDWGYVVLRVDSLRPRNKIKICNPSENDLYIWIIKRAQDAHDAKSYLAGLSYVDKNRIAAIGWSHGGSSLLKSLDAAFYIKDRGHPFRAAVALYPYCHNTLAGFETPLLILIGDQDPLAPEDLCQRQMISTKASPQVILKIYPGVDHNFDLNNSHRDATADAVMQIKNFFDNHMQK